MDSAPRDRSGPKKPNPSNAYLKYSSLAIQLVATIGLFAWLGYKLDRYLEIQFPVFLLTFVLLSFGGMIFQIYRSINK